MRFTTLLTVAAVFLLAAAPTDPDAAFKAGDFAAARQGYASQVAAQPNDVNARLGLATTELYGNDVAAAQRDVQSALALDPSNVRAQRLERTIAMRTPKNGEFAITQHGNAVLPFVVQQPLPIVRMQINGVNARVVIDTGAPVMAVSEAFATAHHLNVTNAGEGTFAGGRRAKIATTVLQRVTAGPVTVSNVSALVGPVPDPSIDAVVGTAFFSHFLATIDYVHNRLILRPRDAQPPAASLASVPMWLVGDHFLFANASVNGGTPQLFNIDSGAPIGVQLTKASMDAAQIAPQSDKPQQFFGGGGPVTVFPLVAQSVAIGGARQTHVPGVYFPNGDQYGIFPFTVAGTVSGGFLGRYAVTFDFKAMRLILTQ